MKNNKFFVSTIKEQAKQNKRKKRSVLPFCPGSPLGPILEKLLLRNFYNYLKQLNHLEPKQFKIFNYSYGENSASEKLRTIFLMNY